MTISSTLTDSFIISDRELARLVLEQMDAAIVICDSSGRVVLANPAALALCGDDPLGHLFTEAFPLSWLQKEGDGETDAGSMAFSLEPVVAGESLHGLCLLTPENHPSHALLIKSVPYIGPKDEFLCCIISMMDVTGAETAQSRLNAIFDGTTDAIYVKDVESRYLMINKAGAEIIGQSVEDIVGKALHEIFDAETANQLRADDVRVMRRGLPETFENKLASPNGMRIFHSVKGPYRDAAGVIVGTVGVSRDVTALRRAQEDLARQAALLDLSPDAILVRNLEGKILFWSRGAALLYGWEPAEVLGKNKFEVLQPEYAQSLEEVNHSLYRDGQWQGEVSHRKRDGGTLTVTTRKVVQYDENHAPIAILEVNEDVSERKRAEQAQAFLAAATSEFSGSLDFESTLKSIVQLAVPRLADWCAVHILMEDGFIHRLAFNHHDPAAVGRVSTRPQQYTPDPNARHLVPHVLRTGIAEYYNEVPDALVRESARDDEHLATLRTLGMEAYMCIPLLARGRTLGTVTFAMSDSGRSYNPQDFELAQELVRRAGLAADNARLYHESRAAEARLNLVVEASSELIATMDYQARLERLATLVVPRFADWCTVNLVETDGAIRLAAVAHAVPEKIGIIREWAAAHPLDPGALTGTPNVIRTGKPEWLPDVAPTPEQLARSDDLTVYEDRLQVCSFVIVPLVAHTRTIGAITFAQSESGRRFSFQDLMTGEEIARRAALALENASLYQQEQDARRQAEENALRISVLQNVTALLGGALAPNEVAQIAVEQSMQALRAQAGTVAILSRDGLSLQVIESSGYDPDVVASWRDLPLSADTPLSDAIKKQETILIQGQEALRATYPEVARRQSNPTGIAWAAIPMLFKGRVLGVLGLTFRLERQFDADDLAFMNALGQQAAQAMERARLYESELAARRAAEFGAQRSAWLTEASHVLTSSLDFELTFTQLAQLAVPYLADWCQIHLANPDGTAEQLVMAHQDPDKIKWAEDYAEEIKQYFTPRWDAPQGLPNVLRTGKSEIYPDIPDALLQQVAQNEIQLQILRSIGYSSVMIVPLNTRGKTLGAITLVNTDSRRHFTDDDLAFAELLAERAAVAMENARLYHEKESLAIDLERRVEERTFELSEAYGDLRKEVVERTRAEQTLRALLRISSKLNSTLDVETSLEMLTHEALRLVDGVSGFAGLRTPAGMQMHKYYSEDKPEDFEYTWPPGVGIPGWVLEHRVPYLTNDAPNAPVMLTSLPFSGGVKAIICAPILDAQGEVLGFIEIHDKANGAPFTDADLEFLTALSPIASIAIQNAQAYQRISDAESALKDAFAQLRALAARLQTIREEERTDIARELHDELGQALTALKMDVASLIGTLPKRNKQLLERAHAMTQQIDVTIKTVRRLSSQLRPGMLDDLGLGPSLEWYSQEFQTRTGITVQTDVIQDDLPLSQAQATALFRIFQETLTNVARHAKATSVDAKLELQGTTLLLRVQDNGQGFEMDKVRGKRSLGLLGMRERAENVHGTLEVIGQPGEGTTILVRVPLDSAPG